MKENPVDVSQESCFCADQIVGNILQHFMLNLQTRLNLQLLKENTGVMALKVSVWLWKMIYNVEIVNYLPAQGSKATGLTQRQFILISLTCNTQAEAENHGHSYGQTVFLVEEDLCSKYSLFRSYVRSLVYSELNWN